MTAVIFLFCVIICKSQTLYQEYMDITAVHKDRLVKRENVKVIWGEYNNSICFLVDDHELFCFDKWKRGHKKLKVKAEAYIRNRMYEKNIVRKLYVDSYNNPYIITIFIDESILIWINRLNDNHPNYYFEMKPKDDG